MIRNSLKKPLKFSNANVGEFIVVRDYVQILFSYRSRFYGVELCILSMLAMKRPFISCFQARVKSGMFGQTAKFGQRSCLLHTSIIGIKHKLTKQTVKIKITYTTLTNLSRNYLVMCKVYTDVGGIK